MCTVTYVEKEKEILANIPMEDWPWEEIYSAKPDPFATQRFDTKSFSFILNPTFSLIRCSLSILIKINFTLRWICVN